VKSEYDANRKTYNDALLLEKQRMADFFKANFEPAIPIPQRPCPPS
jgi:hypothetical protein